MYKKMYLLALISIHFVLSCSSDTKTGDERNVVKRELKTSLPGNYLSMKINGVEWKADNAIWGAFHPKGHNNAIMISGSKGQKDKDEQTFNINLYNTTGPAVFNIENGNPDKNVVQLMNLSPENFMYGSMMGFTMKVTIVKAATNPDLLEATFEGELSGNASDKIKITEGKFYYHE